MQSKTEGAMGHNYMGYPDFSNLPGKQIGLTKQLVQEIGSKITMFNRGGGEGGTTFGLSYREVQNSKGLGIASKTIPFYPQVW